MKIKHTIKKGFEFTNHLKGVYFDCETNCFYTKEKVFKYSIHPKWNNKFIRHNGKQVSRKQLHENCKQIENKTISTVDDKLPF